MYQITITNGTEKRIIHDTSTESELRLASGKFSEEINKIPSFVFTITPVNPCYNYLHDKKTLIEIHNTRTNETEFEGTIFSSDKKMTSSGKVYRSCSCEGFLGYLCDSIQPYFHYENYTVVEFLTALLEKHNAQTSVDKHIFLGSCDLSSDNTNSKTTAYRNTLEEIKVNLIDRLGGEIRIRKVDGKLVLDFLTHYGSKCSTTIELAKNIRSLEVSSDSTNIVTRLIPLGCQLNDETAERLTIASVNEGKIYIDDTAAIEKFGIIVGTAVFDNITLPKNLIERGREYLENNARVKRSFAAQVLDLSVIYPSEQNIRAGNTYRFKNSFIDLDEDLRVRKRTVDIYKPYKPDIEIGDKAERITDITARQAKLIEYEMPKQKIDILAAAKATATGLIKAGINGHVVVNENEILIMDAPEKENATHVWRWNSGGFGYSNTGYDGEYGTAITMDGAIVADFITAGVLRGLEIVNGDGTFHVDTDGKVTASAINITGGSVNIVTSQDDEDVIALNHGANHCYISPGFHRMISSHNSNGVIVAGTGINGYSYINGSEADKSFGIDSESGNFVSSGDVSANEIYYQCNGEPHSVRIEFDTVYSQLQQNYNSISASAESSYNELSGKIQSNADQIQELWKTIDFITGGSQ